jgi:hypothetical protein
MAKRSGRGGVNKSEAIRAYKAGNDQAGPKEVTEALAKDGIKVTPAFVSTVLSNDRRKSGKPARRKGGRRGGRPTMNGSMDAVANLVQAKKLADQMGGIPQARAALDALARILG